MNKEEIIRAAREAGLINHYGGREIATDEILERFAALVADAAVVEEHKAMNREFEKFLSAAIKAEREACAKEVEEYQSTSVTRVIASRIRARGSK